MAFLLTALIAVGPYEFANAESVEIRSSHLELGDECTIRLPNLGGRLEAGITTGMPVSVRLGYDGNLNLEFTGYVAEITPKTPFELRCEDGIYHLKRMEVGNGAGVSFKSITLRRLLETILPSGTIISDRIPEVNLSPYRIERGVTVAEALEKLKEDYLLVAYYRDEVLYVGLPYSEFTSSGSENDIVLGRYARYSFDANMPEDGIDLTYRRSEDVKIKARAISILPDNTRVEVEVGDAEGETRTLFFRHIRDKSALASLAEEELKKHQYEGYRGSFQGFGTPYVRHGASVRLSDPKYGEQRAGTYLAESVGVRFGPNVFRRIIEISRKVG